MQRGQDVTALKIFAGQPFGKAELHTATVGKNKTTHVSDFKDGIEVQLCGSASTCWHLITCRTSCRAISPAHLATSPRHSSESGSLNVNLLNLHLSTNHAACSTTSLDTCHSCRVKQAGKVQEAGFRAYCRSWMQDWRLF
jgi:hypothetical protein